MISPIIPVLLCGGSGTRLWPLSRKSFPKQFLSKNKDNKKTFLQNTLNRINRLEIFEKPILICNAEHRFIVAEQMREIDVEPKSIILEPFGRNTAPAITIASLKALEIYTDPILLFLPADHEIKEIDKFLDVVQKGIAYSEEGKIVTFGIPPDSPETGYGYIEAAEPLNFEDFEGKVIRRFIEKPNKDTAQKLVIDKRFTWNSGIFMLKAKVAIQEIKKSSSSIYEICLQSLQKSVFDLDFQRINEPLFKNCPNMSFDIAVMEKTNLGIVLPLKVGWCDVGNWEAMWKISNKDDSGNCSIGNVFLDKTKNCFVHSEKRLVVTSDIENLAIIETYDAVLVIKKDSSQSLTKIVQNLKNNQFEEATKHRKIYRPWGNYISIAEGPTWQVKTINVSPGASLSLQKHNFRTEHWVVVSGEAFIEVGEEKKVLNKNESIYIPLGCKHRLSNPGKEKLVLIEVQSGNYLGEDDIVRYEDKYDRNKFLD